MNIAIDIDDTMTYMQENLLIAAYNYDKYLGNSGIPLKDTIRIAERYNWSSEQLTYFMSTIKENVVCNVPLRPGVVETINYMHDNNHKIIILTARGYHYYKNPFYMTYNWLKFKQIYFDKLIINSEDKIIDCINEKIDILIDDLVENCLQASNHGLIAFLMNTNENKNYISDLTRVSDFNDVLTEFKKIEKIKRK